MPSLKSQKPHIGIFGRRNVGKSSLINALTNQDIAIVSPEAGTTTDPVTKTLEVPGIGPVVLTDTAGVDDVGELGAKRVARTMARIDAIDMGIIVIAGNTFGEEEKHLIAELEKRHTPFFVLHNKTDLEPASPDCERTVAESTGQKPFPFRATAPTNLGEVIELIGKRLPPSSYAKPSILGDLVSHGDVVLLVTPVDIEAPEGRLILPQVQTIRDCLDNDCVAIVLKERELDTFLSRLGITPRLVVTDSQAFLKVDASVPKDIPLTSFSILFARLKGDFDAYLAGTPHIADLEDDDRVLILESCSHHVAGDDIGRVKIPRWLTSFTGRKLHFDIVAGLDAPPKPLEDYSLIVQCGGCMLTANQVRLRLKPAIEKDIPVTNYGMAIAFCLGIYGRAVAPFTGGADSGTRYL
jgi:[FeFe] hydrogenase H-cluster maturation GTPase HydF